MRLHRNRRDSGSGKPIPDTAAFFRRVDDGSDDHHRAIRRAASVHEPTIVDMPSPHTSPMIRGAASPPPGRGVSQNAMARPAAAHPPPQEHGVQGTGQDEGPRLSRETSSKPPASPASGSAPRRTVDAMPCERPTESGGFGHCLIVDDGRRREPARRRRHRTGRHAWCADRSRRADATRPRPDGLRRRSIANVSKDCGAPGRTRTSTPAKATDFESAASTISPLGPHGRAY